MDRRGASSAAATASSPTASTSRAATARAPRAGRRRAPLRIAFVGQAVERKGLPVLLRAFEALREHVPAELTHRRRRRRRRSRRCCSTPRGVTVLGKVDDERKARALREADVLAAPSLGGESFGMVLTEAFAAGTPVVASDIAGYRDVVRDGDDGVLVPRGDAAALAEALRDLALDPARRAPPGRRAARERAAATPGRGWPREVLDAYEDAIAVAEPATPSAAPPCALGALPADRRAARPARAAAEHRAAAAQRRRRPARGFARRAALGARRRRRCSPAPARRSQRIGLDRIGHSLLAATPPWVLVALGLMCLSMVVRARRRGRDPARRAAAAAAPALRATRCRARDRRADVGDAARPPRRAGARADRRPPAGPPARRPAGRCSARSSPRRC